MTEGAHPRSAIIASLAEVFRDSGYQGASLARLAEATGLKKASLYYHFPGGKEEMAEAVLDAQRRWFDENVFTPLRGAGPPAGKIEAMIARIEEYFGGGARVCLFGQLALADTRDRFASRIADFFANWITSLGAALSEAGAEPERAVRRAADAVMEVEGALLLSRALGDTGPFHRALRRLPAALRAGADAAAPGAPIPAEPDPFETEVPAPESGLAAVLETGLEPALEPEPEPDLGGALEELGAALGLETAALPKEFAQGGADDGWVEDVPADEDLAAMLPDQSIGQTEINEIEGATTLDSAEIDAVAAPVEAAERDDESPS